MFLNALKKIDFFAHKPYFLISSTYKERRKGKSLKDYGSWPGTILSVVVIIILISYLCSQVVLMFNKKNDVLNEYTMVNPFDQETKRFNLYHSNIMPSIRIINPFKIFTVMDQFREFTGPNFFSGQGSYSVNIDELYRYI